MNPMALLQLKGGWDKFCSNHPKFPKFIQAVSKEGVQEGSVIEVTITRPDGSSFSTNLKVQDSDLQLFEQMKNAAQN